MFKRIKIKRWVKAFAGSIILFSLIGFVEKKHQERICQKIVININNEYENYFVDEADVQHLILSASSKNIVGQRFSTINLKHLEEKIELNKFIKDAQVFNDLKGNLIVNIDQMRPLARVINYFGGGSYISTEGTVLPVSSKFTSRVIVISGPFINKLSDSFLKKSEGKALISLLEYIEQDDFLKTQVAQLDISSTGEIVIFPQIGKQEIEFGKAEDIEIKFRKLKAFYKEILPVKGWSKYQKVSLKYDNQIVCE